MNSDPLIFLDYFAEYPLGRSPSVSARHVCLKLGNVPNIRERQDFFRRNNMCWKVARQLEGRESASKSEGVWPVNVWRAQRRIGNPGSDVFPDNASLDAATPDVYAQAREMRLLSYFRIRNVYDAIGVVRNRHDVRLSVNLTHDWYDPPDGRIPYSPDASVCGAHNIPLVDYIDEEKRFVFPNSWGGGAMGA